MLGFFKSKKEIPYTMYSTYLTRLLVAKHESIHTQGQHYHMKSTAHTAPLHWSLAGETIQSEKN